VKINNVQFMLAVVLARVIVVARDGKLEKMVAKHFGHQKEVDHCFLAPCYCPAPLLVTVVMK
jgi:hypothetical protein